MAPRHEGAPYIDARFEMRARQIMTCLVGLMMILPLGACQAERPIPQQRFELRGKVVAVDRNAGTVTLAHEAIPGFMAAMTMAYPLKDKWAFDILKPGQTLHATLVVASDHAWLQDVTVTFDSRSPNAPLAGSATSPVGKEVPDFFLTNQDGKRIHLQQYRGKSLLLTFIYTRCPLPDYCPLMSKHFGEILEQARGDKALSHSTHLLSISIDPEYDKPPVLRAYGVHCAGSTQAFRYWEFASGTPEQVRKVAEFFGLNYWTDRGQIVHALVTALVGPDGRVVKIYAGNDWQPADALRDLRTLSTANQMKLRGASELPPKHPNQSAILLARWMPSPSEPTLNSVLFEVSARA